MPVRVDELSGFQPPPVRDGSIAQRALEFLRRHEGMAYTPREIADEIGASRSSLGPQLTRLARRGLVEGQKGHWYALPDRDVAKKQAAALTNRLANSRWGPEKPEDWMDHNG